MSSTVKIRHTDMRRTICLLFVGSLWLAGCGLGGAHNPIAQSVATKSALAAVENLDRERVRDTSLPPVTGFTVVSTHLTRDTSPVSDSQGDVLTVSPAPQEAWVVEFTAPPQAIWSSASAIAEVDSTTGVVVATGLWPVPANRPIKGG
jgi:hypothetical protein